jgi:hypothetical protein
MKDLEKWMVFCEKLQGELAEFLEIQLFMLLLLLCEQ